IGSTLSARSVVSIIGACRFEGSWASGTVSWAAPSFGVHCFAPAGLSVSSQSYSYRFSRKPLSHFVGSLVHAPSSPLVIVWAPPPPLALLCQPRPCCSIGAPSGSGPTLSGLTAPWVLPKV